MLPGAFIAGAQKSGTTTLHHLLASHPDIFFPERPQELHFFDIDANYARGRAWYEAHFESWSGEKVVAQTSPMYVFEPAVPGRLHAMVPDARLVFVLRHPVDRAYSHYWHEVGGGWERLGFEAALEAEPARIARGAEARRQYSYVERGRYASQLRRFLERFDRSQLLVLRTEQLQDEPRAVVQRCAELLGVCSERFPPVAPRETVRNAARLPRLPGLQAWVRPLRGRAPLLGRVVDRLNLQPRRYPPMARSTRARLEEVFRPEIEALQALGLLDVSTWL